MSFLPTLLLAERTLGAHPASACVVFVQLTKAQIPVAACPTCHRGLDPFIKVGQITFTVTVVMNFNGFALIEHADSERDSVIAARHKRRIGIIPITAS